MIAFAPHFHVARRRYLLVNESDVYETSISEQFVALLFKGMAQARQGDTVGLSSFTWSVIIILLCWVKYYMTYYWPLIRVVSTSTPLIIIFYTKRLEEVVEEQPSPGSGLVPLIRITLLMLTGDFSTQ